MENLGKKVAFEAEKTCKAKGGELPLPTSLQENNDYFDAFQQVYPGVQVALLGLSDVITEDKWLTSKGTG